jgi:acyl dehydratase
MDGVGRGADRFFDDVPVGEVTTGGPIAVSEAAIIAFGREYDPQVFHTDPVAAKSSPFGTLVASGWHVAALVMRDYVDSRAYGSTPMVGMGIENLRWLHPVHPGDVLTVRREILAARRSVSRPDRGILTTLTEVANQDGVLVMRFTTLTQMPMRVGGAQAATDRD